MLRCQPKRVDYALRCLEYICSVSSPLRRHGLSLRSLPLLNVGKLMIFAMAILHGKQGDMWLICISTGDQNQNWSTVKQTSTCMIK